LKGGNRRLIIDAYKLIPGEFLFIIGGKLFPMGLVDPEDFLPELQLLEQVSGIQVFLYAALLALARGKVFTADTDGPASLAMFTPGPEKEGSETPPACIQILLKFPATQAVGMKILLPELPSLQVGTGNFFR